MLYGDNSTPRAGGVLPQTEFIPKLMQDLQTTPEKVIADFNELKKYREYSDIQVAWRHLTLRLVTDPSGIRLAVTGNILGLKEPRSLWNKHFGKTITVSMILILFIRKTMVHVAYQKSALAPVPLASETLNKLGKQPVKKASLILVVFVLYPLTRVFRCPKSVVLSLPTIESSYVNHTTKGIQGFDNPESPALVIALETLNAAEGYLWVCFFC